MQWFRNKFDQVLDTVDDVVKAWRSFTSFAKSNPWTLGSLALAIGVFVWGLFGCVQTAMMFWDHTYEPAIVFLLLCTKLVALLASGISVLLILGADSKLFSNVLTAGSWASNYDQWWILSILQSFHIQDQIYAQFVIPG